MGLVLAFQTAPRSAPRPPQQRRAEPASSADILFFTGVRYERRSESTASPASPPSDDSVSVPSSS